MTLLGYLNRRFSSLKISCRVSKGLFSASTNTSSPHSKSQSVFNFTYEIMFLEKRLQPLKFNFASAETRAINIALLMNSIPTVFSFFVGVISQVLAIAIFSMNDTRKSNLDIFFFINFFDRTYKLLNFFNCIGILCMIIGTCMYD